MSRITGGADNGTPAYRNGQYAPPTAQPTDRRPFRPGEHRREAEAALAMFEDACDEPGGEQSAWYIALTALVHALLDIGERL
jgi:hypothetical protein